MTSKPNAKKIAPYILFQQEHYNTVSDIKDIMEKGRVIGKMWSELSDVQKEEYKRRASEINAENAKLLEEYYQQHPEEKAQDEEHERTKRIQRHVKN